MRDLHETLSEMHRLESDEIDSEVIEFMRHPLFVREYWVSEDESD